MAEQELDRNHAATPYKLQEARKRGQVAKSTDMVSTIVLTVAVVFLYWQGWESVREQFRFDQSIFVAVGRIGDSTVAIQRLVDYAIVGTISILAPFFLTLMLAAIVANLIQTGPVFSAYPLKPDITRVNPAQGLKKLFSGRTLFELSRTLLKLGLLGFVAYQALKGLIPRFFILSGLSPLGYIRTLLDDMASLGLKLSLMLGFISLADLIYTRRQFSKKMKMSQREVKDESKQREGDPRIRSRLRKLRMEMRKRSQAVSKTKNADVVITNPTHLAVALRYEHGKMESPLLVAKGAGMLAAVMRNIARRNHIPLVQNRTLARKLFHQVDFEQHVPTSLYADVARIIVWVFAMRQARTMNKGA